MTGARRLRFELSESFATLGAVVLAVRVEVLIRCRPLPQVASRLGVPLDIGADRPLPAGRASPAWSAKEARQLEAVSRVMRRWPSPGGARGTGTCLRESLSGGHYLRRRGPVLRIGAKNDGAGTVFHAWIEVSGTHSGGEGFAPMSTTSARSEVAGD